MNKKQMREFMKALNAIVEEKGIDRQIIIEAMEQAMAAAYKKKGGPARCTVNPETGEIKLYSVRTVWHRAVQEAMAGLGQGFICPTQGTGIMQLDLTKYR